MTKKLQSINIYKYFIQTVLVTLFSFLLLVLIDKICTTFNFDIKFLWVAPFIIATLAWLQIKNRTLFKIIVIFPALILSYYLFILFMVQVHTYAYNRCAKVIEQKYGELSKELSSNGFFKYHLQARECEYKLVPLPWIGTPEISDNPPGF
ncbi:hypothetical protein A2631_02505 [Candidatus Daviesbacteria bacterium RIFCSPHIGHO2_01_FULL_44_29]|uniref:Uncharacterized protein n=1 Tax=Candidatus Daviesbacteria bacterium RIFCSPHIGHO2_02_FULL_43_12 TaxID=1797776 RepID=A0A1F5KK07_9BACT|nr:MAG: hypothetical protein A2631_02505 [Candidatus Daviesbacteria bacterium RIFCSPHIGHO2_01_FULL_44_29]OGE40188.1 MAG: hypothetical protein A3E86_04400 [Candidatus Daviesbacteria bacterium RIFCSPHIGHO2_12_FULL_47_45]OGE41258.1 MAG: hypothetical protein A3D25_01900 [Candidatus Daviesbacteria bacterium RIFCSPHIGHO2_02_FULL_43_12]OGE69459.1 MAG: hypothetical protein A3B55_03640 [Candidatus Daviesbacteria bacterium RIFCSPLOWO2_01_FULL_43_15]